MRPKFSTAWFMVSIALVALLLVQSRILKQRTQKLEELQLQVEKMDGEVKALQAELLELKRTNSQRSQGITDAAGRNSNALSTD